MEKNPDLTTLPEKLVAAVAAGQDASPFRSEISSMSPQERLQLVQNLNKAVLDCNQMRRSDGFTADEELLIDVRLAKNGTVVDIDLLRPSMHPNRDLTRVDLYDSGCVAGEEADQKQRHDAITWPYEQLFNLYVNNDTSGPIEKTGVFQRLVGRMTSDVADPAEAKKIEANFLYNLKNPEYADADKISTSTSTQHSKAMFLVDAFLARRDAFVPDDVRREIDEQARKVDFSVKTAVQLEIDELKRRNGQLQ
jgi:hypothetical protein